MISAESMLAKSSWSVSPAVVAKEEKEIREVRGLQQKGCRQQN